MDGGERELEFSSPPLPPPLPQIAPAEFDVDLAVRGIRVRCRAQWDLFDWVQDIFTLWASPELIARDGGNVGFGFNVYWLREDEPGSYTILTADYRGDPDSDRTDDLSEALWIHSNQSELMEIVGSPIVVSRMDHVVEITPAARTGLDDPDAVLVMTRVAEPRFDVRPVHSGWTIRHSDDPAPIPPELLEPMPCSDLAHRAPALATALALPPNHTVTFTPLTLLSVSRTNPHSGATEPVARWDGSPAAPVEPELITMTRVVGEHTLAASVDPEYRGEIESLLRVFERWDAETRDGFGVFINSGWFQFRQRGDVLSVMTSDLTQADPDVTTDDLTGYAMLRRRHEMLHDELGGVPWDWAFVARRVRVHAGALDGVERVMRRVPPVDNLDTGWVVGTGSADPDVIRGQELLLRAPELLLGFILPVGCEVTSTAGVITRVVDPAGVVRLPRIGPGGEGIEPQPAAVDGRWVEELMTRRRPPVTSIAVGTGDELSQRVASASLTAEVMGEVTAALMTHEDLVADPLWNAYALAMQVADDWTQQVGLKFRSDGQAEPGPTLDDTGWGLVELRGSTRTADGHAFDLLVLKVDRPTGRAVVDFLSGDATRAWPFGPLDHDELTERMRPTPADFDDPTRTVIRLAPGEH